MKKIWMHKAKTLADAEKFDFNYYSQMSSSERLDIIQYLRELYLKINGNKYARRKRLCRVIKVIQ